MIPYYRGFIGEISAIDSTAANEDILELEEDVKNDEH